jgi:ectoine hydroxylase-related dioxygenase (phytanoyl-CoA dioxygenase family)
MSPRITDEQVNHWLEHGYVIVERFLTEGELRAAREAIATYFPSPEQFDSDRARHPNLQRQTLICHPSCPFPEPALNAVMLHPELLSFCRRALRSEHVALVQSGLGAKYAGTQDFEQNLHLDYGNNDLAVPRVEGRSYQQVAMLLYYTDVTEETSPTFVVSMRDTRDLPLAPRTSYSRQERPDLYANSFPVVVPAGSVLIYSMRTWHRGSGFKVSSGACRFHHGLCFADRRHPWQGMIPWAMSGGSEAMNGLLTRATPEQRELIGFPPVGHDYWNEQTLTDVAARYPGMEMAPYHSR